MPIQRAKPKFTDVKNVSNITADQLNIGQIGGRRNMLINGGMQVAQRSTSETGVGGSSGYFTVDRFRLNVSTSGRFTMSQSTDTPNGFSNSLKLDCTTADTSIAADEQIRLNYRIEGQDLQQLKKGTSDAEEVTLSFYAKVVGSATKISVQLKDNDNSRSVAKLFTLTTSWARYTYTFPADTTGAFDNDNNNSLLINFYLHAGSNFTSGTLATAWESNTNANLAAGLDTSFVSSTDNEFYITGIQLEVGSQATPFEHRSFGEELSLCQRYYQVVPKYTFFNGAVEVGSNSLRAGVPITRPLRASPTIGNITLIVYDDDDTSFSNAAHAVFANSGSYEVDGSTGFLSVVFNGNLSGRTDNHNVTALYGTDGTLDAEL